MPAPVASPGILCAQSTGTPLQTGVKASPIPSLQLTLPAGASPQQALVTLNLPNPYATGTDYPGGLFTIVVDGVRLPPFASFTYPIASPTGGQCARVPTTLVVSVALTQQPQTVQAYWEPVRSSTVHLDSPATLSAVII